MIAVGVPACKSRAFISNSPGQWMHLQYLFVDSNKLSQEVRDHCADIGSGARALECRFGHLRNAGRCLRH